MKIYNLEVYALRQGETWDDYRRGYVRYEIVEAPTLREACKKINVDLRQVRVISIKK